MLYHRSVTLSRGRNSETRGLMCEVGLACGSVALFACHRSHLSQGLHVTMLSGDVGRAIGAYESTIGDHLPHFLPPWKPSYALDARVTNRPWSAGISVGSGRRDGLYTTGVQGVNHQKESKDKIRPHASLGNVAPTHSPTSPTFGNSLSCHKREPL